MSCFWTPPGTHAGISGPRGDPESRHPPHTSVASRPQCWTAVQGGSKGPFVSAFPRRPPCRTVLRTGSCSCRLCAPRAGLAVTSVHGCRCQGGRLESTGRCPLPVLSLAGSPPSRFPQGPRLSTESTGPGPYWRGEPEQSWGPGGSSRHPHGACGSHLCAWPLAPQPLEPPGSRETCCPPGEACPPVNEAGETKAGPGQGRLSGQDPQWGQG